MFSFLLFQITLHYFHCHYLWCFEYNKLWRGKMHDLQSIEVKKCMRWHSVAVLTAVRDRQDNIESVSYVFWVIHNKHRTDGSSFINNEVWIILASYWEGGHTYAGLHVHESRKNLRDGMRACAWTRMLDWYEGIQFWGDDSRLNRPLLVEKW